MSLSVLAACIVPPCHPCSSKGRADAESETTSCVAGSDDGFAEELERAAHLLVTQAAEATHEQQRVDADGLELGDLCRHLIRGAEHHAAQRFELVVGAPTPHPAGQLLEPCVGV